MGGSRKKKSGAKKGSSKKKPKKSNGGGAGQAIASTVSAVAKELLPELFGLLAFPTSGAGATASPGLALGRGGYNGSMALQAPAANGTYVKHGRAKMRNAGAGMRVCHREYVEDITFGEAGIYMNVVAEPINPGNRNLFPWLASIASRFETYRFNSLKFIYEPQCGTDTEGTVMVAVDFDAVDPPPVDKLQIMTYDGAVRSPPWFAGVYECRPSNLHKYKEYFVTPSRVTPTSTDIKTYMVGNLFVATQSLADPFTSGELYVEYDIVFLTPQLSSLGSVAGFYVDVDYAADGVTVVEYDQVGQLEVMFTNPPVGGALMDPFSSTAVGPPDQAWIIEAPGAYLISASIQLSGGAAGMSIETSDFPPGFTETSHAQVVGVTADSGGVITTITWVVINFNGPLWFWFTRGNMTVAQNARIFITPLDENIYNFWKPLVTPVITAVMTRVQCLLARRNAKHKSVHRAAQVLSQMIELGETDKQKSAIRPLVGGNTPRNLSEQPLVRRVNK